MPDDTPIPPAAADLRARLDAFRRERGFLLPHHGALGVAAPALLDAYFAMYRELTLTDRHLTPFEREYVWLALLVAERRAIGTHHVDLFAKAGATEADAGEATRLVALALGAGAFRFIGEAWPAAYPGMAGHGPYLTAVEAAARPERRGLAHLALAAVQAAREDHWALAAHIEAAYAAGVAEDKLAEALSLTMWPAGVNRFVDACGVWLELMRSGRVAPSERYAAWAAAPGQGGFEDG